MRKRLLCVAWAVLLHCSGVSAQTTLLYDMEGAPPPDGFGPNGLITVSQDSLGATQGVNSMRNAIPGASTFVGALTTVVPPALNNPPGVDHILFDMTIDAGDEFTGLSAAVGVTIFGFQGSTFGLPSRFADTEAIGGKAAGTYRDIRIDLDNSLQYPGKSFNDLLADGDFDGVTGFQFVYVKSNDDPVTVYIDNVRAVVPEPTAGLLLLMGAVGVCAPRRQLISW